MLPQEAEDNGEGHHGEVVGRQLLVARRDPPEPLQAVDAPLDDIPPLVRLAVELAGAARLLLVVRDDWLNPPDPHPFPQPTGRALLVPGQLPWLARHCCRKRRA